jgi:glutamine amidotransferase
MAYSGAPVLLERLLFQTEHSLIDQSMSSRSAETPTNGDGFGVGWYGGRETPGLYRSVRPAWNDFNLRDLAAQIEAPLFIAHVRATSLATIQETNCHPFRYGQWLFVHNGEIHEINRFRRELMLRVAPELFNNIQGTTDSELFFHLALTFGLERDPLRGLALAADFVEETARQHGVEESLWMTIGVSDGKRIYAVRYASDGEAPTLYHSRDAEDVYMLRPRLKGTFSPDARIVVSEPVGTLAAAWVMVPQGTALILEQGKIDRRPFQPLAPA